MPTGRREADHLRCVRFIDSQQDGLLHISELRKINDGKRVEDVEDVVGVGQKLQVEITKIDDRGKLSLAPVVEEDEEAAAG